MLYNDEFLDRLREIGDPIPDQIIADLAHNGEIELVNRILRDLVRNDQSIPSALPDEIENWLRETDCLPVWADHERIERANAVFMEYGVQISFILSTSSLINAYAARKGVRVLTHTYRLNQCPYRRIGETAQFVLLVLSPGSLSGEGHGIPAIQKVRLMHSAIRHLINQTGEWDAATLGVPICQEDLLGTLMTFTALVVRDLPKLGVHLTNDEIEDYLYMWRVIGTMLGIRPDLIPETMEEAAQLSLAIETRHHGPSPEGVELTKALLLMYADLMPGEVFDGLFPALMRELVGEQIADWLEIPRSRWERFADDVRGLGFFFNLLERNSFLIGDLVDRMGMALLSKQAIALAGYERAAFEIPQTLRDHWDERQHLRLNQTHQ